MGISGPSLVKRGRMFVSPRLSRPGTLTRGLIGMVATEEMERAIHLCLPGVLEGGLGPLLDLPRHVLERAERQQRIEATFVLLGERADLPVAGQKRLLERGEVWPIVKRAQGHRQVIEPVAVTAVVEVNGANLPGKEEGVPAVQIRVN